ncbi:MAG: UTP--glucose-1-phosphate uridylyltransferase [Chloroflexota bacterium]
MSELIHIITATHPEQRDQSLDTFASKATLNTLLMECKALDDFRRQSNNLYERVRALFFLYAIHRFHIPTKEDCDENGSIPFQGYEHLLNRRFEEAINLFLEAQETSGANKSISSALASAYHSLGFQTLANQVRKSVRTVRGNQWMFRAGHPEDHPLRVRRELLTTQQELFPILQETTPVRMDLTHSGWSDIFFLGMDFPEGARVINVSIDLAVRGRKAAPKPPVEAYFRIIDEPVIRLASVDLGATAVIDTIEALFDFARDYLGLLKAAIIASGIVPPGMEGAVQPLHQLLEKLIGPGKGFELISKVNDIPKGSRLAVSTNLLACLITVCMRATGQAESLTGGLTEAERRLVAARAILGEWIAGSGGGWQDSGGVWPGMKMIHGEKAAEGDPEWGISRGRLLPSHHILERDEVSVQTREALQNSLVLVHGGMAQDVGPILEMVTEKYLLRSEKEWHGRQKAITLYDHVIQCLKEGEIQKLAQATHENFHGPIQTIIPWAGNRYTDLLIEQVQDQFGEDFWGFWMLGGMAGGGMGFIFAPHRKAEAQDTLQMIMSSTKRSLATAVPFAMEPVVYDFAINEKGTWGTMLAGSQALMPASYYKLTMPQLLRQNNRQLSKHRQAELDFFGNASRENPEFAGMTQTLFDALIPQSVKDERVQSQLQNLLDQYGFDPVQHEQIRTDLRSGRIGLSQNRLPVNTQIEDVPLADLLDATQPLPAAYRQAGIEALQAGKVAVVSLAGGAGSRWTKGAGVVKALNPFVKINGRHRSFVELHLAKSKKINQLYDADLPHIFTTSYLTHEPIYQKIEQEAQFNYPGTLILSQGQSVGLRLIPMSRDLRFAWEEQPQQRLDEQAQKMQDSVHKALIGWAQGAGEGSDYTDNLPNQCLHPVGHWYEVPNLLLNGSLADLLDKRPSLTTLMVHNIDTVGANVDPAILGAHLQSGAGMTTEVITRELEDRGGGLARVNGRVQLIEGLALPYEEIEFKLSYYNSSTTWVDIDQFLALFGLDRALLNDKTKVETAVRQLAARMPTYITLKDVKKRWGNGQEDIFPVTQFEKLWGDMTALPELNCRFIVVPRQRGQQIKEVAQLDGWLRDGSGDYLASLCAF